MNMDVPPTIERRIRAAMALAGLDFDTLAERINTPNYKARTLRKIADENEVDRLPRDVDLHLIGKACGVGHGWWTIDFAALEDGTLQDEIRLLTERVNVLTNRFEELAAESSGAAALQAQALREHRERDHRAGGSTGED